MKPRDGYDPTIVITRKNVWEDLRPETRLKELRLQSRLLAYKCLLETFHPNSLDLNNNTGQDNADT